MIGKRIVRGLIQVILALTFMLLPQMPAFSALRTVSGITVDTSLPNGTNAVPYSFQIAPTGGGGGPYSFVQTGGALPLGLTISSSGLISGTSCEKTNGSHSFSLRITSGTGTVAEFTGNDHFNLNMTSIQGASCTVSLNPIPTTGTQGTPYSATITASGGSGTGYSFALIDGALPTGLTFNASGAITGTPTVAGPFTFTVQGTDSVGNTGLRTYTITVAATPIVVNPPTLTNPVNGTAYSATLTATGGSGTGYSFAVTAGSLPPGLSLSTGGALSGTPNDAGTYTFTVTATDSVGGTGVREYTLVVQPAAILTVLPPTLPTGTVGSAYAATVSATGGSGGYQFEVLTGTLPGGLSLAAGGALTGTPTAAGTFSFTVKATDSDGNTGTRAYTVTIQPLGALVISPPSLPDGTKGTAYSQTLTATGGSGTGYSFAVSSGSLPAGLTLSAGGAISGTPTTTGSFTFTAMVTDSLGNTGTHDYNIQIGSIANLVISPPTLPNGTNGAAYNATLTATGGTGTGYSFAVTSGTLPPSLTLSSGGVISGIATSVGTFTFTVTVTDSGGNTGTRTYTVTISAAAVLTVNPPTLPEADVGSPYSQTITATGGTGSGYSFVVSSGSLPAGITLGASGLLSGTPTAPGDFDFVVTATDSAGNTGTRNYTLHVHPGNILVINPPTLPTAYEGTPYSATVVATGGTAPYTYSVQGGALPAGLTLAPATGLISGTPTASGSFTVTIGAVDAVGNTGTRTYTFTVTARPDPSKDAEVIGLIDAQFTSASRFAEGQLNNLMRHLDGAHAGFTCGVSNEVRLTSGQANRTIPGQAGDAAAGQAASGGASSSDDEALNTECAKGIRIWAAGSVDFGRNGSHKFNSDALTAGIDAKLSDQLIVGAAAGLGFNDSKIGRNGTKSEDDATTVMGYLSVNPTGQLYFDAVVGRSWVKFDSRRYVTVDRSILSSKRKGDVTFASASMTGETDLNGFTLAGYARYDYLSIELNGFAEQSSVWALTFGSAKQKHQIAVFGLRADRPIDQSWGVLTPMARIEYRHRMAGHYHQVMAYSDMLATQYTLSRDFQSRNLMSASAGVEATINALTLSAEYGTSATSLESFDGHTFRVMVRSQF